VPHHKRHRRKSARAGCTCGGKLYKHNGFKGTKDAVIPRDRRAIAAHEPLDKPTPPAKPQRKKGKKLWIVEKRRKPGTKSFFGWDESEWCAWSRHYTKQARDEALRCQLKRYAADPEHFLWKNYEFRAAYRGG
jgi:hypothetical protein